MQRLRIAVVGVGTYEHSRARGYLAVLTQLDDRYDLCALCDSGADALRTAGDLFGVEKRYDNVTEMLEAETPDVVFVLVPTDGQIVVALAAVEHGCHLITEIPYGDTLAHGDFLRRACEERNLCWEIAENVWRWPRERLKRLIVERGLLGTLNHARLWYASGSYHGFNGVRKAMGLDPRRVLGYAQELQVPPYATYGGARQTTRWWESAVVEHEGDVTCLYEMPPGGARGSHWDIEGTGGYLSGNGMTTDELVLYRDGTAERYPFVDVHEQAGDRQVLTAVRVDTDPPVVWENPFAGHGIGSGLSAHDDVAKASILNSLHRAVTEGRRAGVRGGGSAQGPGGMDRRARERAAGVALAGSAPGRADRAGTAPARTVRGNLRGGSDDGRGAPARPLLRSRGRVLDGRRVAVIHPP